MLRLASRPVTLTFAVLLFGCTGEQPLEPSGMTVAGARAVATLAAPSAAVAVAFSETRIDVRWTDNTSNETSFEILRSPSGESGSFAVVAGTGANAAAYSDEGLQRGTQYCYAIRAVRATARSTDYSPPSNTACTTTPPVVAAPTNVAAVAASSWQVDVTWKDNSSDETRFQIYQTYSDASGAHTVEAMAPANATTYRFAVPYPAKEYCFRVRAVARITAADGSVGEFYSAYSNTTCATTPQASAPVSAYAVRVISIANEMMTIYALWTDGSPAPGIRTYRSTDGGGVWEVLSLDAYPDNVTGGRWLYDRTVFPSERPVCYRLVAFNAAGDGPPSETVCVTPPAEPSNFVVTAVDAGTVELTWSDNSAFEDGFELTVYETSGECCYPGGGCNSGYSESDPVIARLPANTTAYRTPGSFGSDVCGYSHWVEVRAWNGGGYSGTVRVVIDP